MALYLALIAVLSGSLMTWMILHPQQVQEPAVIFVSFTALMWTPALASIITRLVLREGFADVSFRFGGLRTLPWYGVGLAVPIGVGTVAYGLAAALGLITFTGGVGTVVAGIASLFVAGLWITVLAATGEEIGWRGYLLTHLIDAEAPRPILLHGFIWACWHLPLIFGGLYVATSSPWLTAGMFVVVVMALAVVMARVRLATGSIWPCAFLHGAWNAVIQGPFDRAVSGEWAKFWVGEGGVLTMIVMVVLAMLVSHGRWTYLRTPARTPRTARA